MKPYFKKEDEVYIDYFVRLFENKKQYGLTSQDIADLLNNINGKNFTESKYRKEYAAFDRGRKYEKNKYIFHDDYTSILSISDIHYPYNLPIENFSKYVNKIDILQINGDVLDMQSISKFSKVYRISFMEEIIGGRKYLIDLINYLKPKKVVINYGNHDIRFINYLSKNIDVDLKNLMPKTPLELIVNTGFNNNDRFNFSSVFYEPLKQVFKDIEIIYTDNWYCQIGDTIFCHPTAYSSGILKTAEKALMYFRNEGYIFKNIVMAHTHKIGYYIYGNSKIYEQGCCCNVKKMNYTDGKLGLSQSQGYLYLCQDANGNTIYDKTKLEVIEKIESEKGGGINGES